MEGNGHYDRFRDRIMFPIRDALGRTVGFGGRILPTSPLLPRASKYYNSAETPLFNKSEQLYGLDAARVGRDQGRLFGVVEGYTDVLMAHQMGVPQVVATMGTALNAKHVHKLRTFAPRVVLVFDADAGGDTGVDRALEIFAGHWKWTWPWRRCPMDWTPATCWWHAGRNPSGRRWKRRPMRSTSSCGR